MDICISFVAGVLNTFFTWKMRGGWLGVIFEQRVGVVVEWGWEKASGRDGPRVSVNREVDWESETTRPFDLSTQRKTKRTEPNEIKKHIYILCGKPYLCWIFIFIFTVDEKTEGCDLDSAGA